MTMLDKYIQKRISLKQDKGSSVQDIWQLQELIYRIGVLETFQIYCNEAPMTSDMNCLIQHFQMLDAYIQALSVERRYGVTPDKETEKRRETAHQNLMRVIYDYRKKFSHYAPSKSEQYKLDISNAVNTILAAWLQFRNTYVEVKSKEDNHQ